MLAFLIASLTVAYLLTIWFDSRAVIEYAKLLGIDKILRVNEYLEVPPPAEGWSFPEFLNEFYWENFVVKIVVCPTCLAEWLAVPVCVITGWMFHFWLLALCNFAVAFLGLTLYYGLKTLKNHGEQR